MMKNLERQLELPLECYANSELTIRPMGEAIDALGSANHGIVAPLDECTWNVHGYRGCNSIFPIAGEKPTALGLYLHIYHRQPFTIDDAETLINQGTELGHGLFIAWAARFNKVYRDPPSGKPLPKELWPFLYVKVPFNGNAHLMRPAYRIRKGRTSFVVMGVDRDQVEVTVIPDWSFFWREFLRKYSNGHD